VSIEQAIDAFWQIARGRTAPGPEWMKRLSREEAYRVQLGVLGRYVQAGERQASWKVGLTSKAKRTKGTGRFGGGATQNTDWSR
jgi:2-keto-4-pentenoate hydratase